MSPARKPKKITVYCSATWTETLTVEVPEDATEEQAEAVASAAIGAHWFEPDSGDIEVDEWEWVDDPTFLPNPPKLMGEPTDAHWFHVAGHRWVTDGWLAVREDSARPTIKSDRAGYIGEAGWMMRPTGAEELLAGYFRTQTRAPASGTVFLPRTLPVLEQGELRQAGVRALDPVLVLRNEEVIALVMPEHGPMDGEHVAIRDGRPVLVPAKGGPS